MKKRNNLLLFTFHERIENKFVVKSVQMDCPKQGKGKVILVILQRYSEKLDKTVHEPVSDL